MSDLVNYKSMWLEDKIDEVITQQVKLREQERLKTQEGIEERIYIRLRQIWQDVLTYNPDSKYLSLTILDDQESISFSAANRYYYEDKDCPIRLFVDIEHRSEEQSDGTDISR